MPPSAISVWHVLSVLTVFIIGVIGSVKAAIHERTWLGLLSVAIILSSMFPLITTYSANTSEYLSSEALIVHLSEQTGNNFVSSTYNKRNSILSVNDEAASYNFLVSSNVNLDGQQTIYLTLQR